MHKTLLRKVACNLGIECFSADLVAPQGAELVDVDSEALGGGLGVVASGVRAKRVREYYDDPNTFHELAVFAILIGIYDKNLVYPLLGDPGAGIGAKGADDGGDGKGRGKLSILLDREKTVIGVALQQFLDFVRTWNAGGSARRPCCVLDFVKAPTDTEEFMRWARSQVLRLSASVTRRFETKFSSWPFALYPLCDDHASMGEKQKVAENLVAATRDELDIYTAGIRRLFPGVEQLLSPGCKKLLASDFASHPVSTDLIERLHTELSHNIPVRAPGLNFTNCARTGLLKQAAVVHTNKGGKHPLQTRLLGQGVAQEIVVVPRPLEGLLDKGIEDWKTLATPAAPEALIGNPAAGYAPLSADGMGAILANQVVPMLPSDAQKGVVVVTRSFADTLAPKTDGAASSIATSLVLRKGLSPFLLERNKQIKAARDAKGASLTPSELAIAKDRFQRFWDNLHDKSIFQEAYKVWQQTPAERRDEMEPTVYRTSWAGGCTTTPIASREFCRWISERGWPSDTDTYDSANDQTRVPKSTGIPWGRTAGALVWSAGSKPHNVPHTLMQDVGQFKCVERGLFRALEKLGKAIADKGDLMMIVQGPKLGDEERFVRFAFIIAGVFYNPKVFEAAKCEFASETDKTCAELTLPSRVFLEHRACRVSESYQALAILTSDELVLKLTGSLADMELQQAKYDVARVDGTLLWSDITATEHLGFLWARDGRALLGQGAAPKNPKGGNKSSETAFLNMFTGDPFAAGGEASRTRGGSAPKAGRQPVGHRGDRQRARAATGAEDKGPTAMADPAARGARMEEPLGGASAEAPNQVGPTSAQQASATLGEDGEVEDMDLTEELAEIWEDSEAEAFEEVPTSAALAMAGDGPFEMSPANVSEPASAAPRGDDLAADFLSVAPEIGLPPEESEEVAPDPSGLEDPLQAGEVVAGTAEVQPWEKLIGPSPIAGYVSDGQRSVMRIQRGKPKNRVTVTCYRHRKCGLLLNEDRCPPDSELLKWVYEVEATPGDAEPEVSKALSAQHIALGKARWSSRR